MKRDLALACLDDLLHNGQPEADPLMIELRRPVQLSEAREELLVVPFCDTGA